MKLQVSLDRMSFEEGLELVRKVKENVDIVEIGTPMIYRYGLEAVKKMRKAFPEITILADMKIADGGDNGARLAFEAEADIVTVLAVVEPVTVKKVIDTAKKYGKKSYVDMLGAEDFKKKAEEIDAMGPDYIGVHCGFDLQELGQSPLEELHLLRAVVKNAEAAVAGGIELSTIEEIAKERPAILICGKGITKVEDPADTSKKMREIMDKYE